MMTMLALNVRVVCIFHDSKWSTSFAVCIYSSTTSSAPLRFRLCLGTYLFHRQCIKHRKMIMMMKKTLAFSSSGRKLSFNCHSHPTPLSSLNWALINSVFRLTMQPSLLSVAVRAKASILSVSVCGIFTRQPLKKKWIYKYIRGKWLFDEHI